MQVTPSTQQYVLIGLVEVYIHVQRYFETNPGKHFTAGTDDTALCEQKRKTW